MKLFISDNKLNDWLNNLLENHVLLAPIKKKELTFFKPITKVHDISFDF